MHGIDPRTGIPAKWSLQVPDTLGLIFWTKDPLNLVSDQDLLTPYPLVVHLTLTGWSEVEYGAPDIEMGIRLMRRTVRAFGTEQVVWRFSPVPQLPTPELLDRFKSIADQAVGMGLSKVYLSFLQDNDLMPEIRPLTERSDILSVLAEACPQLQILLCQDDLATPLQGKVLRGVCEDGSIFGSPSLPKEGCGCAMSVDPFTINESCNLGCRYCYAADQTLSGEKRNTTLRVLP